MKKSLCITGVFYLVAKTYVGLRAVWHIKCTCLGHWVPKGECVYLPYSQSANALTIQGSIQWRGVGSFHPKKIELYIVQITIEKALLDCQNQP